MLYFLPYFPFSVCVLGSIYDHGPQEFLGLDPKLAWIALMLQPIAFFLLYCYLDNVIDNPFGISKKCCYCIKREEEEAYDHVDDDPQVESMLNASLRGSVYQEISDSEA